MAFISGRPYQLNVVSNMIVEYISLIFCQIQAPSVDTWYSCNTGWTSAVFCGYVCSV